MKQSFEYQIYIGCTDSQSKDKLVQEHELKEMVADFFARNQIGFSILSVKGGFYYSDGWFAPEDTLCINVVGDSDLDIMKLARSLSMYMNQECCMITRNALEMDYS